MLRCVAVALLLAPSLARAAPEDPVTGAVAVDPAPAEPVTPPPPVAPCKGAPGAEAPGIRTCAVAPADARLWDEITLTVENLDEAIAAAEGGCASLVLFVGGLPILDNPPNRCDPDSGHVGFLLERNEKNAAQWNLLLGEPTGLTRDVTVTVGSGPTRSYPRHGVVELSLNVLPLGPLLVFGILCGLTVLGMGYGARHTALLREPPGASRLPATERPYSLARAQQAFWFVLASLAYVFVWLMTWDLNTLTPSVLALIAISGGTGLAGEIVSATRTREVQARLAKRQADPATESSDAEITALKSALERKRGDGFLTDLLSDADGISLQRAQIVG